MPSGAYYNEHDAKAAAWLRELIAHGHIAPGDVDERSIIDVQPSDLTGYAQCHFFAGIGVWSYALRESGWADDSPVWTGSCPCQSFSASGKREGFDDPRHLWPAWFRLLRECRPDVCFGEQVASKDGRAWFDVVSSDLEGIDYAIGACDTAAAGVGAPHIRQRLYFVADANGDRVVQYTRELRRDEGQHEVGAAFGDHAPRDRRATRAVADDDHRGRGVVSAPRLHEGGERRDDADGCGEAGGMADAERAERWPRDRSRDDVDGRETGRRQGADRPSACCRTHELGDPVDARCQGDGLQPLLERRSEGRSPSRLTGPGATSELGDASAPQLQTGERQAVPGEERREEEWRAASEPSRSFWSDAEWLACRDGKARPVEPGTFPLVDGAPARVGRLRGYGNALCAPQAIAFIEAYRDVTAGLIR